MATTAETMGSGSRGTARAADAEALRIGGDRPSSGLHGCGESLAAMRRESPDGALPLGARGGGGGNARSAGDAAEAPVRRRGAGDGRRPRIGKLVPLGDGAAATIGESA